MPGHETQSGRAKPTAVAAASDAVQVQLVSCWAESHRRSAFSPHWYSSSTFKKHLSLSLPDSLNCSQVIFKSLHHSSPTTSFVSPLWGPCLDQPYFMFKTIFVLQLLGSFCTQLQHLTEEKLYQHVDFNPKIIVDFFFFFTEGFAMFVTYIMSHPSRYFFLALVATAPAFSSQPH